MVGKHVTDRPIPKDLSGGDSAPANMIVLSSLRKDSGTNYILVTIILGGMFCATIQECMLSVFIVLCVWRIRIVLEENATTLFLTDMMRGLGLTFKVFWEKKVTVG